MQRNKTGLKGYIARTKKCKELVRTQNNIQIVINSLSQTCVGIWDLQEGHRDFQLGLVWFQFARKELTPESVVPKMTDFPFNKYVVLWEPSSCFISSFGDQKMTRYDKISLVSICFNISLFFGGFQDIFSFHGRPFL